MFQDFFAGRAVKACPGVAPGVGGVGAVVDGVHGADEKASCFQMVGVAAALVDAFAVEDHVEKVVWAHGRAEGVVRAADLPWRRSRRRGCAGFGFSLESFFIWVGLLFLGYSTKTQFWVTKWDGMLYEVIIQYWVSRWCRSCSCASHRACATTWPTAAGPRPAAALTSRMLHRRPT